ncbi:hypothetical protein [Leptospira interrogans]|uniref:hypothetical protein n=1 Tax=Leptospira interrogans TaxID=173 RepID=UPI0007749C9F|nr:hypothetical protein [Leptospira interrogans]
MKKLSIIVLLIISSIVDCQTLEKQQTRELTENFKRVLRETNILIRQIVPPKFNPVSVNPEVPFRYDYALKSEQDGIEIRYTIHSIPAYLEAFAELKKSNPHAILVPPKKTDYIDQFFVNLHNLAGGMENVFSTKAFPTKAVKDEFGADWSSISFLGLNPDYKDYQYCELVVLHKDNVADVYIMYLSKDRDKLVKFVKETYLFYNLRFL